MGYDRSVAEFLCSQHRDQDIRSVKFILLNQQAFTYVDYRFGKRPLDDEFLRRVEFGPYTCHGVIR